MQKNENVTKRAKDFTSITREQGGISSANASEFYPPDSNFNISFLWQELESTIIKIISYLKDIQVGEDLRKELISVKQAPQGKQNFYKIDNIIAIINHAVLDNNSEGENIFFLQLFRLCSLYLYSIGEKITCENILDDMIKRLNTKALAVEGLDPHLQIQLDRMLINKAQIFYWEKKYGESRDIFDKVLSVNINSEIEINYYSIKMVGFLVSALTYRAWIELVEKKSKKLAVVKLDQALKFLKMYKEELQSTFEHPDYRIINKREVKVNHQYFKILTAHLKKKERPDENILFDFSGYDNCINVCARKIEEIIQILSTPDFEDDEDVPKSSLVYYYLVAGVLSLKIKKETPSNNNIPDVKGTTSSNTTDIEKTISYLSHLLSYSSGLHFKNSFKSQIMRQIDQLINLILMTNHKSALIPRHSSKFAQDDNNLEINFESKISAIEDELNKIISMYINNQLHHAPSGLLQAYDLFKFKSTTRNYALENIEGPNLEVENNEINEIFLMDYVTKKMLSVVANAFAKISMIKIFDKDTFVMESLNGYLLIERESAILINLNTLCVQGDDNESMNDFVVDDIERYATNKIFNNMKFMKMEAMNNYYHIHFYDLSQDVERDLTNTLIYINAFYSLRLYNPCILWIISLLGEFKALMGHLCGKRENTRTIGYLNLYYFFVFLLTKLYMKTNEFAKAFEALDEMSNMNHRSASYSKIIFHTLLGICLSKMNYSDLAVIYFQIAFDLIVKAYEECNDAEDENSPDESIKIPVHENTPVRTLPEFSSSVKMLKSIILSMKYKAGLKFKDDIQILQHYCTNCKKSMISQDNLIYLCHCKRAFYCSSECKRLNKKFHRKICARYYQFYQEIEEFMEYHAKHWTN